MSSSEDFKAQGNQLFTAKKFDEAIEAFSKAIELSPEPNHVLYSNRSACYASLKKFDNALQDAQDCVKINPSWAKGYNRVGAAQFGLGQLDDAKLSYSEALKLDPSNKMAQEGVNAIESAQELLSAGPDMGLGQLFSDPNMIAKLKLNPKTADMMKDPALVAKVEQMRSNPQAFAGDFMSDPRLMTVMGVLLGIDIGTGPGGDSGSTEPAPTPATPAAEPAQPKEQPKAETKPEPTPEVVMEEAPLEEDTNNDLKLKEEADSYKQEANGLYKKRNFDEAIALYNKAWETFKDITYLNNRSAAEFEKGDYEQAINTCKEAVETGRELRADYKVIAKSFARMGSSYLKLDDLHKAKDCFERSLTEHRTPDTLNKLRSTEKLIKTRDAELYVDPEKAEEARIQGRDYFQAGDWPNAVKAYTEMVKRAPEDARGYSNRAAALAKLMSFPEAIQDCDMAIKKDPNFLRAFIRKATAQLAIKDFTQALETLTEARTKAIELKDDKSIKEIDGLYNKAMSQRFTAIEGETELQTMERVSKDPEVVAILQDPVMNSILQQARENPAALQDHMKNPDVYKKINTLIAAGIIRTR